jgi:hypothetical protein
MPNSIEISGTNQYEFAQTNTCGTSLAPAASCTINVTFTPAGWLALGAKTATLSVAGLTVTLNGTGATLTATLTPAGPLTFAAQTVNTISAAQSVTLTNTGVLPIPASNILLYGTNQYEFAQTNTCGTSLAPAASCTVSVTFTPHSWLPIGAQTATLGVQGTLPSVTLNGTAQ